MHEFTYILARVLTFLFGLGIFGAVFVAVLFGREMAIALMEKTEKAQPAGVSADQTVISG